jgi:GT2 family glycosyltransferase
MNRPRYAAVIATHNRATELARTIRQLHALAPAPDEILICADGCTDGTAVMVRENFPHVTILENPTRLGSVPSRDRLLRTATGELVLSLDDDSYPIEPDFLQRAAEFFDREPRLAVLWFPQRSEEFPASLELLDFGPDTATATFVSSGAVLRRSAYLALPGYPPLFGHSYEEPDFGLQCISHGFLLRRHTGLTIRHHYSGRNRNEGRTHRLHARNEQWSIWMRCPAPWWPVISARRTLGQFRYACGRGPAWIAREPQWWLAALRGARAAWRKRQPVSWSAYRRWLKLLRRPEPLGEGANAHATQ